MSRGFNVLTGLFAFLVLTAIFLIDRYRTLGYTLFYAGILVGTAAVACEFSAMWRRYKAKQLCPIVLR